MKIFREFVPADRYVYDWGFCSSKNGFAQVDTEQDASYFGTWANPITLTLFCYCEGDCTTTKCENAIEFVERVRSIKAWNEDHGYRFIGIDPGFDELLKAEFIALGLGDLLH